MVINLLRMPYYSFSDPAAMLGELAFGEPFGSVKNRKTDTWIATILNQIKYTACFTAVNRLSPRLTKIIPYFIPKDVTEAGINHVKQSKAKILHRIEKGDHVRRDFCSYIFEKKEELKLTEWNLAGYAQVFIVAGSETSATTLTALAYYLCRTPRVYQKLKDDVRRRFQTSDQITSLGATFPYLTAVIQETLRIYPPVPVGVPRITPKGGAMVAGVFVPEGVGQVPVRS